MADKIEETVLTLVRQQDGRLKPYVDGKRVLGCVDVTVNTNSQTQAVQLIFHSSLVLFETAKHPGLEKLH